MAVDQNSAVGQAETANNQLAAYFSLMNKYIGSGGNLPNFNDYVSTFDFSELHRMSTSRAGDTASYQNGAAIENINQMIAINREYDLRTKGKQAYYSDAESDFMQESNYYSTLMVFWVNMLNNIYEEGKTS